MDDTFGSGSQWRRFHAVATILWLLLVPLAIFTGWIYSVAFVSAISLYANVASHWAGWQAGRTEELMKRIADE